MQQVACPHCNAVLVNDPATAGRVVRCYACDRQLEMPPLAPIPVEPEQTTDAFDDCIDEELEFQSKFPIDNESVAAKCARLSGASNAQLQATRPCKYCGNHVSRNAKTCPRCGGKAPYPLRPEEYALGIAVLTAVVGVVCLLVVFSGGDDNDSQPKTTPSVGETFQFKQKVFAGRTKDDNERMTQLCVAKDNDGLTEMILQGRLVIVAEGTRAKLIDFGMFHSEVRILSGPSAGSAVWVATDFVEK